MFQNLFDGSQVNLLVAYLAGFVTFFASCLLPLVPTYLAYLSGVSLHDQQAESKRWQIFKSAFFFVVGFSLTFIILGATLNRFALVFSPYRTMIEKVMGGFFILMGLMMLGVFKTQFFSQEKKLDLRGWFTNNRALHAIITGVAFGFGWTPCIGPVLAVILFWSSQQASLLQGIALLSAYSIGLGTPFLLVGLLFEKVMPLLKKYKKISFYINIVSGVVIILAGLLIVFDQFSTLSMFLLHKLNFNGLSV